MSLTLKNVNKVYTESRGQTTVLKEINFSLGAGEVVAIAAPSGSGKSTLLHIMGLLDNPTAGKVLLEGKDCSKLSDKQKARLRCHNIGFVYQFHHLLLEFSALENLIIPQLITGLPQSSATKNAEAMLEKLGLSQQKKHMAATLSGGEQQRVAVARALINKPKFLLADEPTGNLDGANSEVVADLLFTESRKHQIGVAIVTHDMRLAGLADKIMTLQDGRMKPLAA